MRRVSIFGATGSVGRSTVDLVLRERERFQVVAISGSGNIDLLASQARELRPEIVVTADAGRVGDLAQALAGSGIASAGGREALVEAASRPVDWVMSAIIGFAGLEVSLAAAGVADVLALANKESMVCGGSLLRRACAASGCRLIPVDSEHSAVFQALPDGLAGDAVERVVLTASGGPQSLHQASKGGTRGRHARTGGATPELGHGAPHIDRQRHHVQQVDGTD